VWIGVWCGLLFGVVAAAVLGIAAAGVAVRSVPAAVMAVLLCAGAISGAFTHQRAADTLAATIPTGHIEFEGRVAEDEGPMRPAVVQPEALRTESGWRPWTGPAIGVGPDGEGLLVAGRRIRVVGMVRSAPGRIRGDPIAGRVTVDRIEVIGSAGGWLFAVGNAARDRVRSVLDPSKREQALVAGFLIGDTAGLSARDLDQLRRSGLTHFIAVSGSNVALFLAAWWALTAVLGFGPKRRFALGAAGLAIFIVMTRWEASVLRAAFMAATVLGGAATGVVVDAWVAVGLAVAALLLVSGQLAADVGFQLSVAATLGILAGAGMFAGRRPRAVWATFGAACAAQIAVVPVLLIHFGTVPLMSPIANLLSAPLVTGSTVSGALAVVVGWAPAVAVSAALASGVLRIAALAARWPQLGPGAVTVVVGLGLLIRAKRSRPIALLGAAAMLAFTVIAPVRAPEVPMAVFLDVGQGDATLLIDPGGGVALVDGGADPIVLAEGLRRHHIGRIDLLVASHGDVDHVGGFAGIVRDHAVGRLWVPDHPDGGPELARVVGEASAAGVPIDRVGPGFGYDLGSISIEVLGPRRRYAARNDGSIVLWVGAGRTLLLAGDIGEVAQGELPALEPDVLLVPHHGSSSTDRRWLEATVGSISVISVGPNTYGHPAPEIVATLAAAGTNQVTTMEEGDVSVELGSP
jgi:competence protein ComEC